MPLGTVIGAVMETALNSDVPGFARAITTRDVLSFDGSQVVIPAGSHVVGEYKSGVAQGASRIFIVWTRLVRPDGVAIALASPATDDLGGGGLGGKVSRHFLERFRRSGAALGAHRGAKRLHPVARARIDCDRQQLQPRRHPWLARRRRGTQIPPTIKTRQGATVRIFVARDLDFSGVGPGALNRRYEQPAAASSWTHSWRRSPRRSRVSDVTDVYINRPGELWLETQAGMERHEDRSSR